MWRCKCTFFHYRKGRRRGGSLKGCSGLAEPRQRAGPLQACRRVRLSARAVCGGDERDGVNNCRWEESLSSFSTPTSHIPYKKTLTMRQGFFVITTYGIKKLISSCKPNPALCCLDQQEQKLRKPLFLLFLQIRKEFDRGKCLLWPQLFHGQKVVQWPGSHRYLQDIQDVIRLYCSLCVVAP